jgi:2-polyprenyl-6-methoxyphenol hydroxylase-like FAD-dependent oxidoreductase
MKIIIAGGSIAGLSSALTLGCVGHDVHVYERSATPLRGRGGGVVVLRHMLRFLEQHGQFTKEMISVPTRLRRRIGADGQLISEEPEMLPFSSWDSVYRSLCSMLPSDQISYGKEITSYTERDGGIEVHFDSGNSILADVLIAGDGGGSRIRAKVFPEHVSTYAGYVAWRGIVDESVFAPSSIETLVNAFTMFREPGHMFMAFLIPGINGSLEPGRRRFNWLWYRNESDPSVIDRHLTDNLGQLHHSSIGPGRLSSESISELRQLAKEFLPDVLQQLVRKTQQPFFQSIYDALSPSFSSGRVALVGDAACTVRPHTGSGTSKAADDAISLADALGNENGNDVQSALQSWAARRREDVERLLRKGPELAAFFGLGHDSSASNF